MRTWLTLLDKQETQIAGTGLLKEQFMPCHFGQVT